MEDNRGPAQPLECQNLVSRVYFDLCEVRGWWNVKVHEDKTPAFISGYPSRHEQKTLVLPISSHEMVSPEQMSCYLQTIRLDEEQTDGLTLAICEPDTTTVYYKITQGLVQPENPEFTDFKKQQRHQTFLKRKADIQRQIQNYTERIKQNKGEG